MHRYRLGILALSAALLIVAGPVPAQQAEAEPGLSSDPDHGWTDHATGYLGVTVRTLNPDLRRHFGAPSDEGVLIASVAEDSPAAAAGLLVGDVLVRLGGRHIDSSAELRHEVRDRAGERVAIEVFRDGEPRQLEVALQERVARRFHGHDHQHDGDDHWDDWDEDWGAWGEAWAEWGARFGERWGRWGEEMGERWGERGAEWGEIGAEMGAIGAEIGVEIGQAFADMNWDELGFALDESMAALDAVDWDEIGDEIEDALEEATEELERSLEELEEAFEDDGR